MRYQGNALRVWFTPEEVAAAGLDKPLAEVPIVKDRWISNDAEVLSYPPRSDEVAAKCAQLPFGGVTQRPYPNPEVAGGHIALIATNNNPMQVPPPTLYQMHASLQKQIAFNRRMLKAENQSAGINSGLGDFLQDMSFEESDPVFVGVGVGHTMRGNQRVGGQLWIQSDRQMTATNKVQDEMDGGIESAALSAIVETVSWRHALENTSDPNFQRRGRRILVHPKFLSKFATVLTTGNLGLDLDGGHDISYGRVMAECMYWSESFRPLFLPEDSSKAARWPVLAEKVSKWMKDARQIAVGGYKQVQENGPDRCSSDSDSEDSDHGETWSYADMHTSDMLGPDGKPKKGGPQVLSSDQAFALRAVANWAPDSAEPTIQAWQKPLALSEPAIRASSNSARPLAPLDLVDEQEVPQKVPKKNKSRRAGGQGTAGVRGTMDARATQEDVKTNAVSKTECWEMLVGISLRLTR
jgi:hypothetical protein